MDTKIKTLLQKFYDGNTSIEEEKLLQKYFAENDENTEDFAADKHLFANINLASDIATPADLTEKINAKIDYANKNTRSHKYLHLINLRIISAVACIALLISITAIVLLNSEKPKFIANINTNEAEIIEMLEHSFAKISNVVDDAVAMLDVADEQVCEINEVLNNL
ncbi:MAG: hypothetical protein LBQ28_01920 [Prevotellaceae bacterium]|jgi:hypothetical protein|nr:hypothetical protein [Prevotellaceae bacterium]